MTLPYIILAVLIFFLLIFVHETGHLVFAKLMGVQVNEFALGMGPKVFGRKWGETEYVLRALPIGGACMMEGEDDESDNPRAFGNKPARKKAVVLVAGSLMNIVLAVVVLSMLIFSIGTPTRTLAGVSPDSPAFQEGLSAGDTITSVDGQPVASWAEARSAIVAFANAAVERGESIVGENGVTVRIGFERDGEPHDIDARFYYSEEGQVAIGIVPEMDRPAWLFFRSFGDGAKSSVSMISMMYESLGQLVTGRAGVDDLTGPVGIVAVVSQTARSGGAFYVWQLLALISLNLGIVNLLPFPALDGGRLLFLVIRKATGKAITDRMEGVVHLVGIMALFAFMIFITYKDIGRFIIG